MVFANGQDFHFCNFLARPSPVGPLCINRIVNDLPYLLLITVLKNKHVQDFSRGHLLHFDKHRRAHLESLKHTVKSSPISIAPEPNTNSNVALPSYYHLICQLLILCAEIASVPAV
jgi:hypothetical protein